MSCLRRLTGVLLAALLLAGCGGGKGARAPEAEAEIGTEAQPQAPSGGTIGLELYQPTLHAILAVHGGVQTAADLEPITTRWRRAGSGEELTLVLRPDEVLVQPMEPGRYELISAAAAGRDYLGEEKAGARAARIAFDPGEVIYAGKLIIRESEVREPVAKKPGKKSGKAKPPQPGRTRIVFRVENDSQQARETVALRFPQQARLMKARLLKVN